MGASTRAKYAALGVLFGCFFPFFAAFINNKSLLIYMIDTAPLFLGLFAYLAGSKQEQIQVISKNNEKIRFRYVEKIAKFGICERDLQTLEGKWSEGYCKIFGLPARDQAPPLETHLKFIHKDDRARVQAHYIEILSGRQKEFEIEFRILLKNGTLRWIKEYGSTIPSEKENHPRFISIIQDITTTALAEEEIRFYKTALEHGTILSVTNTDGLIIYANAAFLEISEYSNEELIGKNHNIIKSKVMSDIFFSKLWKTISKGMVWRGEICNQSKSGKLIWLDTTIIPSIDSTGKIVRYTAIRQNATERKLLETQLWAMNEMQRAILAGANYSIISTDTQGTIQTFNQAAEKMLGYPANEMIGEKTFLILHDPKEITKRAELLTQELKIPVQPGLEAIVAKARLKQEDENEWIYIRKDGTELPVKVSTTAIYDKNGILSGFLGISRDISESNRISKELIARKEEAIAASKTKSAFLANMSHEIRTPMNGIIGMTHLLLTETHESNNVEKLKIIQNCSVSLLELINDILDFSKLEAEKIELEMTPFSIHSVTLEMMELLKPRASEKGIQLVYQNADHPLSWITGDVTRFKQILTNLVANAIKFTESGSVEIFSTATHVAEKEWKIQFSVKDTGIGIPEDVKNKLFLPFSQVDASTTRRFGGSGLGLAISKGLCDKMGGTISVESEVGKGSTFSFTFNAPEAQPLNSTSDQNAFAGFDPEMGKKFPLRILIAEDNQTNQLVIKGLLGKIGYYPDLVSNGKEVLDILEKKKYDLVLMDCHMPDIDGFEATQQIIAKLGKSSCPMIFALSASKMKEDIDRCYASGMNGFLEKPIVIRSLIKVLFECSQKII